MKQIQQFIFIFLSVWQLSTHAKPFTIMLDPAGDAKHTGRQLDDSLERGISLQCAEKLQATLEKQYPLIRVVLTRVPGETLQPLQNAHFANRLNVDLYIRLQFYQEQGVKPHVALYQFSLGDEFISRSHQLAFHPYDQAHIFNQKKTVAYANEISASLKQHATLFDMQGIYKIPFKPLIGVQAPAIAIEMSLKSKDSWQTYIQPLSNALGSIIKKMVPS